MGIRVDNIFVFGSVYICFYAIEDRLEFNDPITRLANRNNRKNCYVIYFALMD